MDQGSKYLDFLKKRGRALSEINPGSDEMALSIDDALQAIELIEDAEIPILGVDILFNDPGKLAYSYENWYCEKLDDESHEEYSKRSCVY